MKILNVAIFAILQTIACTSEVVVDDAGPSRDELPAPRPELSAPSNFERTPGAASASGMGRRAPREIPSGDFCTPGEAWRCTLEDGTCGVQGCIDGEHLTECTEGSPVDLQPPDDSD